MNVAILGTDVASQSVAYIIENGCNLLRQSQRAERINVVAYTWTKSEVSIIGDKAALNFEQFAALYRKKIIEKIIFPREVYSSLRTVLPYLRRLGVKITDIWIAQRLSNEISLPNFLEPYLDAKFLPYLEFHIADHCNLNCKACQHYSGLVKEPHFPKLEKFTRDFERLHEFIDDVGVIRILGGEPLLNSEVSEYVKLSRRLYPQSVICVVTNALLLQKMPEYFFETLRQCKAQIDITFYPPLESKLPTIEKLLKEKGIEFTTSALYKEFGVFQTLKPHDYPHEIFLQCFSANCHNFYEGKIAACYLPFMTKYFNAYYGKSLPEDGALDLYDETLTTEKLKAHLLTPLERCRYCTKGVSTEWRTIKNPSPITDWVHD